MGLLVRLKIQFEIGIWAGYRAFTGSPQPVGAAQWLYAGSQGRLRSTWAATHPSLRATLFNPARRRRFGLTGGASHEVAAAGIEAGCPQGRKHGARVLRRRPWEPTQSRWARCFWPRTTAESPQPPKP